MIDYSTCSGCGELLHVTNDERTHPNCEPVLSRAERLAQDYRAAVEMGDQPELEARLEAEMKELDARPPQLGAAVLVYASWGWPVFPLKPGDKVPATRHGFKDATTDPERLLRWWDAHPDSNIGLATGHLFDVIDIDVPKPPRQPIAGAIALVDLKTVRDDEGLILPDTHGSVATASGGAHLYVEPTGDGNRAGFRPGVDFRGIGGYVVAPPSVSGSGRSWAWVNHPSPKIKGS